MVDTQSPEFKKHRAEYMRNWRDVNPVKAKEISLEANRLYRLNRHENYLESKRKYYHNKRLEVQAFFGSRCAVCGNTDHRVLQLDHINGGGNIERMNDKKFARAEYRLRLIQQNPKEARRKYQLLCANCNWVKKWENKETGQQD